MISYLIGFSSGVLAIMLYIVNQNHIASIICFFALMAISYVITNAINKDKSEKLEKMIRGEKWRKD